METKHHRRVYRGNGSSTNYISDILHRSNPLSLLRRIRKSTLKYVALPITVMSTTFLTSKSNAVYASVFEKNVDTYKNPTNWSPSGVVKDVIEIPENIKEVFNALSNVIEWFKKLPENITEYTFSMASSLYDMITTLILKTPLWIFDNQWFENTSYIFGLASFGIVTVLTVFNGIKRMLQKETTDFKEIAKRWFIVAGLSSIAPTIFYKFFQFLNWASEKITDLGASTMSNMIYSSVEGFDFIVMFLFNITLISMSIPILLKNARRFFDILFLASTSSLAGVAWIFDSHRHLFTKWWNELKHLSLVQIVYAFYLFIIGLIIYGVPTPPDDIGKLIKLLMVIGGFYRLVDPPNFVKMLLDSGKGINEYLGEGKQKGMRLINNFKNAYTSIRNPAKRLMKAANPQPHVIKNTKTRMYKFHGK